MARRTVAGATLARRVAARHGLRLCARLVFFFFRRVILSFVRVRVMMKFTDCS
jgi:hypothetical protein